MALTVRAISGETGSFDLTMMRNSWGPPIPSCIMVLMRSLLDWPGCKVVAPTTGSGGQQPSTSSTFGLPCRTTGASPTLR